MVVVAVVAVAVATLLLPALVPALGALPVQEYCPEGGERNNKLAMPHIHEG